MFESPSPARGMALAEPKGASRGVTAIFALTPSESKRLIAKAVAVLPEVQKAYREGWLVISRGTTNAYLAEEILGLKVPKYNYCAGIICDGALKTTSREERMLPYVLHKGQPTDMTTDEAVKYFGADDVFVKGANAVDPWGNAGVLVGDEKGGTIGGALGSLAARGSHLIVPVGLEKLIPSVPEAARVCGIKRFKYALDMAVGLVPIVTARVVTEIQALALLAGVKATHVGSGGIGGSEGAVALVVEGTDEQVQRAWDLVQAIKGEPAITRP